MESAAFVDLVRFHLAGEQLMFDNYQIAFCSRSAGWNHTALRAHLNQGLCLCVNLQFCGRLLVCCFLPDLLSQTLTCWKNSIAWLVTLLIKSGLDHLSRTLLQNMTGMRVRQLCWPKRSRSAVPVFGAKCLCLRRPKYLMPMQKRWLNTSFRWSNLILNIAFLIKQLNLQNLADFDWRNCWKSYLLVIFFRASFKSCVLINVFFPLDSHSAQVWQQAGSHKVAWTIGLTAFFADPYVSLQ